MSSSRTRTWRKNNNCRLFQALPFNHPCLFLVEYPSNFEIYHVIKRKKKRLEIITVLVSVSSISFPGFLTFPSHSLREKPWKLGYRILWTARQRQSSSARVISSWKSKEQKQKTNYVKRKEWIHVVKAKWELVRSIPYQNSCIFKLILNCFERILTI